MLTRIADIRARHYPVEMPGLFELAFAVAAFQASGEVLTRERLTPIDLTESMAGTCGAHRYSVELQHDKRHAVLSLKVDDRRVSHAETAKVVQSVKTGYFMYEPRIAECFWDRPNARITLLIGGPGDGGNPTWLSFEVSPEGQVSAVRQD